MGRLNTIVEKLNKELEAGASKLQLLQTTKMLLIELEGLQQDLPKDVAYKPTVAINTVNPILSKEERSNLEQHTEKEDVVEASEPIELETSLEENNAVEEIEEVEKIESKAPSYDELEKEFTVLKVDEDEIAAELEQMGNDALSKKPNQTRISNDLVFDPIDDIPTLSHQTQPKASALSELNERMGTIEGKPSLNDHLKVENKELSNTLSNEPIKDLKKGIGLNDSYLFINELFRGDETMYTRSIKTINGFTNFAEARFWIERELKLKLGWSNNDQVVKHFDQLVRRRFS
jgi:hypothetical protein